MPVDVLLFDFGGTLDADGHRWSVRWYEHYRAVGGRLEAAAFESRFRDSDRLLASHPAVRWLGFRDTVRLQSELLEALVPDGHALPWGDIASRFAGGAEAIARRNAPLLAGLASRYQLGVVSNFTGNLRPCLEELKLAEHFEILIDSAVEGWEKPDPQIFTAALQALHCPAPNAWVIGDNPDADIRPALLLGCSACWLAPAERSLPPGLAPTLRIAALPELVPGLEAACTG